MQQVFSQEVRFKQDDGSDYPDWEHKPLGQIFSERSERGYEGLGLLSVTKNNGVVKRSSVEGKDNSSSDKSNYKRVLPNDLAYNSMRMWQGASGLSLYEGIVSPAYTVLVPKAGVMTAYFAYLFKLTSMVYTFQRNSQGLTSDTWNLKYRALSKIKVRTPSSAEQQKTVSFLTKIGHKINQAQKQLDGAKQYKLALLQQMFV